MQICELTLLMNTRIFDRKGVKAVSSLLLCGSLACASRQTQVSSAPQAVATAVRVDTLAPVMMTLSRTQRDQTADPFYPLSRMEWPGPNRYRSANGAPGPDYWQQRADYRIMAELDTTLKTVKGSVQIRYTNNSPDSLQYLWLQLDQNLYRTGSEGSMLFPADSRWGVRGFQGGYDLRDVRVNGKSVTPRIRDTMMQLLLPEPLRSKGGTLTITMDFSFNVPEHGSDRMGRDGTLYEIAQWYPRMAVYDDVKGWNTDPYLGQGEFYLEYGNIDFSVTVPAGYTVAASGVLQNPTEVLTNEERTRLGQAVRTEQVVPIIAANEARSRPTPGAKTWRFRAEKVRDVAWAAAPDFRWDATSWNGILMQAYYQWPKAGPAWQAGAEQTQWTIRHYSEAFFPFPYPQATSVAGPVGGMEYPMFVMVAAGEDSMSVFSTINHEHGHEWFPMIVGSNERRYAWMDEGFNTYINTFAKELRWRDTVMIGSMLSNWKSTVDAGIDVPLMTAADNIPAAALGAVGYRKPAVVLLTLRNHVVGPAVFDSAFRTYIRAWAFKHPTPGDFFRTIENAAGLDLSWFWREFWYTTDVLDIGIDSVTMRQDSGQNLAIVSLHRMTPVVFPVRMRLKYANGATGDFSLPVSIWANTERFDAVIPVPARVVGARLWPVPSVPDWNSDNDRWGDAPASDPERPVTRR
jgi:Peptidase family M1 domain